MFEKKEEHKPAQKSNMWLMLVLLVFGIFLAVFVIRPGVVGYGVYQQVEGSNLTVEEYAQNVQQLARDLEVTKTNLSSYSAFTGALIAEVGDTTDQLTECKVELERGKSDLEDAQETITEKETEISTLKSDMDNKITEQVAQKTAVLEDDKSVCQNALEAKETEVTNVQGKYDLLVKNTAKSVCCKAKVDNPQINFYDIADNKIICLTEGKNELTC
ncbi:MAG TPA: hypothetical protein VJA18_01460 [Candidatus Nanoarchaeia archaeon]|nr:hypothetical protein [Candidatus Nanoarchaeia archaeon]